MQEHGRALADGIIAALPGWVVRSVERLATAYRGSVAEELRAAAAEAGERAVAEMGPRVRALLEVDVDAQATTPLALLRSAVRYPTEVLSAAGVPPVVRDGIQERLFPEDVYDLAPATFADLDPDLHQTGLAWGAARAFTHLQRHGDGSGGRTPRRRGTPTSAEQA